MHLYTACAAITLLQEEFLRQEFLIQEGFQGIPLKHMQFRDLKTTQIYG